MQAQPGSGQATQMRQLHLIIFGGVPNVEMRRLRKPTRLCFNGSKTSELHRYLHF